MATTNELYDGTPVTEIDIASSKIITMGLKSMTPEIRVISEEHYSGVDKSDYFWLVDPLDGTNNYINNGSQFCINIALIKDNFPILGLIYSPVTKDLYYAFKNFGSYYKKFNDEAVEMKTSKLTFEGIKNIYTSTSIKSVIIKNLTENLNNVEVISSTHNEMCAGITTYKVDDIDGPSLQKTLWDKEKLQPRSVGKELLRHFIIVFYYSYCFVRG